MRTAKLLVSLVLLLLVITRVVGIRLEEESRAALQISNIHEKLSLKGDGSVVESQPSCEFDRHCSGRSRRLIGKTSSTSKMEKSNEMKVEAKGDGAVGSREDLRSAPPPPPARKQPQTYPDILDIAGMDYSPAKRKPPIHN
ncbi:uncharacterized protein [Typha latifolia]|uniref:uncharacterized protein n=1 Tax=Typha latifolia TaxID=4733 RepID=UPI003C2E72DD